MNAKALYRKADEYKKVIDKARPLNEVELNNLQQYFNIGLTYSSNALEGNSLTLTETKILIEDGLTVGGKPLKDCYEATGHADAFMYMMGLSKGDLISEETIRKLHYLFYRRINPETAGQYREVQVFITGTEYLPPAPGDVPAKMKAMVETINQQRNEYHPIEYAARLHKQLVDIHPFEDGNGRTARLLMNLALVRRGYGIAIIPPVLRREYIDALEASQRKNDPDIQPFLKLTAQCVIESQKDYCRLLSIKRPTFNNEIEK